jgi:UDP-2,3-diacylglucosamine pyrophosphatase LpxH
LIIPFEWQEGKLIIFSDQHNGARNGADDFALSEPNYIAALDHYNKNDFSLICMGDSEELWENTLGKVKKHNQATFAAERRFVEGSRFIKIFGNHDLYWDNDPIAWWQLKKIYNASVKVYEGAVLAVSIGDTLLQIVWAQGDQGDARSVGNWFSKFFVANIWAPLQAYLHINPNTPAYDRGLKTLHNEIMYQWSSRQKNLVLVTGHTHQPVFASLTLIERLYKQLQQLSDKGDPGQAAELKKEIRKREKEFTSVSVDYMSMRPSYFNSGCCCFSDGDITGIEIEGGCIRLVKWKRKGEGSEREVLENISLSDLVNAL